MCKFLLLFLFILVVPVKARSSDYSIPICKNLVRPQSFLVDSGVTCESIERFEKIFQTVQRSLGLPSSFPRVFFKSTGYESWSTFGNLILVNQRQMSWDQAKTNDQRDMVWIHEIGHLVFQEMLKKDFKELDCFTKYMEQDAEEKWRNKNPLFDTSKILNSFWSSKCKNARDLQTSYSELFADFIVSTVLNDINAPLKYMQNLNTPQSEQIKILLYDFGSQHPIDTCLNEDPHFYFAPSRSVIGSRYFPVKRAKNNVIELYNVLKDDLLLYNSKGQSLSDCKVANLRLIPKIK
ncbi:MAG: hypothetical protein PHY93_07210 [Bacteriovorax sp.]|nr:hypothetical protein [Bacteriovorax sp.]